jgi:hypothetical protein
MNTPKHATDAQILELTDGNPADAFAKPAEQIERCPFMSYVDTGAQCCLPRGHEGVCRYKCADPDCPGLTYPASRTPHPKNCGARERPVRLAPERRRGNAIHFDVAIPLPWLLERLLELGLRAQNSLDGGLYVHMTPELRAKFAASVDPAAEAARQDLLKRGIE